MNKYFSIKSEEGFISMCPLGTGEISNKEFISDATFFNSEDDAYKFMVDNSTYFIKYSRNFYIIECVVVTSPRCKK
jgi:hypothetical protein